MFYDFLIVGFLLADAALVASLVLELKRHPEHGRKAKIAGLILSGAAWLLVFYGSFIEPELLFARKLELKIPPIRSDSALEAKSESVRAAVIADFHAGPYLGESMVRRVVNRINKEEPDLVLILGDFVSKSNAKLPELASLKDLKAPVFAVLGNHDYIENAEAVKSALEELGIKVLVNDSAIYESSGARFVLVGLDDIWFGDIDFEIALSGIKDLSTPPPAPPYQGGEMPKLLLVHNPDAVLTLGDLKFDAVLAAHTHGGQLRLPGIGPISPIPTELGRKYDRGAFDWRGMPFIITQGIGVTGPRARLFSLPEILILDIVFQK